MKRSDTVGLPAVSRRPSTAQVPRVVPRVTPAEELARALSAEKESRCLYIARHRELLKTAAAASSQMLLDKRRAHVKALRAEYDVETGKDLKAEFADVEPATDDQIQSLAEHLSRALCVLFPQSRSQSSYVRVSQRGSDGSRCRRSMR